MHVDDSCSTAAPHASPDGRVRTASAGDAHRYDEESLRPFGARSLLRAACIRERSASQATKASSVVMRLAPRTLREPQSSPHDRQTRVGATPPTDALEPPTHVYNCDMRRGLVGSATVAAGVAWAFTVAMALLEVVHLAHGTSEHFAGTFALQGLVLAAVFTGALVAARYEAPE